MSHLTPRRLVRIATAICVLGLISAGVFVSSDATTPLDYRLHSSWREADYGQISRNFVREQLNPLYPRVDWRGDTSGLVESEFPFLPWITAVCVALDICDYAHMRSISALAATISTLLVWSLARRILPTPGALASTLFFSTNALFLTHATAAKPEALLLMLSLSATYLLVRWYQRQRTVDMVLAGLLYGTALLAKGSAIAIAPLFAYATLRRLGLRGIWRDKSVWLSATLAIGLPLAWYTWAHQHHKSTGLSLGLSNETHLTTVALLPTLHKVIWQNVRIELAAVFTFVGLILSLIGFAGRRRDLELPLVWYVGVLCFYAAIANTSGDEWARYYHIHSLAPVSMFVGAGVAVLLSFAGRIGQRALWALVGVCVVAFVAHGLVSAHRVRGERDSPVSALAKMYLCHQELLPGIPQDQRILLRGGMARDSLDQPVAYNESMGFWWLDRKGWNAPSDQTTLEDIEQLVVGYRLYWVTQPDDVRQYQLDGLGTSSLHEIARCSSNDGFRVYRAQVAD